MHKRNARRQLETTLLRGPWTSKERDKRRFKHAKEGSRKKMPPLRENPAEARLPFTEAAPKER